MTYFEFRIGLFFLLILIGQGETKAQVAAVEREATAVRLSEGAINLDGRLDEAAWSQVFPESSLTEFKPMPYAEPKQRTEVRFAYDNRALYIGARMWDTAPDSIPHQLIQRDGEGNSDTFGIWFNCFNDGINGVHFMVTPDGVQVDELLSSDGPDVNWNAVWAAECRIDEFGWIAEIALPWSVFRFQELPEDVEQQWGMNFYRYNRRYRSEYIWRAMDPNQEGLMNQGGILGGIQGIQPPPRISLYPYASSYLQSENNETGLTYNGGMDLKMGLGEAFTFDMTLVPDFGQVVADNLVLNLSPYEVQFNENRQFFTEGTELFRKTDMFYSRRVADGEQLLNAAKISGRNQNGTGLALLHAVSQELPSEGAEGSASEDRGLTDFSVAVVDQNLPNNGYISIQSGQVIREGSRQDAWVGSAAIELRDSLQRWSLSSSAAINRKPGSISGNEGHAWSTSLSRTQGRLQWTLGHYEESEFFDPNDIAFLSAPNEASDFGVISYRIPQPFEWSGVGFNFMSWELEVKREMLYAPRTFSQMTYDLDWKMLLESFDFVKLGVRTMPYDGRDYFSPRLPGRYWQIPKWWAYSWYFSSDYRREFALDFGGWGANGALYPDWHERNFRLEPFWRPNDRLTFSHVYSHQDKFNERGWASNLDALPSGELLENTESLWASRNNFSRTHVFNAGYVFDNRRGITFRLRHYWSRVENHEFYLLGDDGLLEPTNEVVIDDDGTSPYDISYNAWSIDCVYRWIFAPGSELSVVWKNVFESQGEMLPETYSQNLQDVIEAPHVNSLSIKAIYFLDYASLRGQR
ncbi:MAG: DUF5916 domain-containing protein [Flavobacteriales bacterium]|nr:DUF5916 domain-containing protein [Flavobacteriales bacterium]